MDNKNYPSDLTDEQWKLIEPLLPPAKTGGRPRNTDLRQVMNGILKPPAGQARWTMWMLADEMVEMGIVDHLSRETVRRVLKKTNSSRTCKSVG